MAKFFFEVVPNKIHDFLVSNLVDEFLVFQFSYNYPSTDNEMFSDMSSYEISIPNNYLTNSEFFKSISNTFCIVEILIYKYWITILDVNKS